MAKSRRLFVPNLTPGQQFLAGQAAKSVNPQLTGRVYATVDAAGKIINAVPAPIKDAAITAGVNAGNAAINYFNDKVTNRGPNNPGNGGGGGSSNSQPGKRSNYNSGYALSKAPNPSTVNLNSNVRPNCYVSDNLDAKEGKCSPLHITTGVLSFPTYVPLQTYFDRIISFDIQSKAQSNVGFSLNISTVFTDVKIREAFNAVLYALQVYYFHMSIDTYHSEPANKNEGMIYLRQQFTPSVLEALSLLGRRLMDTPVPPKLFEFVRYLNGNYFSGVNQGSPLIKICPLPFNQTTGSIIDDTAITAANTGLQNYNEVFALLRRAVPQWTPKVLMDVPVNPAYDGNFTTLFANLPFSTTPAISTFTKYPKVSTEDESISYNSFINELDGVIYACTSVSLDGSTFTPGLMTPVGSGTTYGNTRLSFYEASGVKRFYPTRNFSFLNISRSESYKLNESGTSFDTPHIFGTDKVLGVNAGTIRQTAENSIDYLMSLDMIKKPQTRGRM